VSLRCWQSKQTNDLLPGINTDIKQRGGGGSIAVKLVVVGCGAGTYCLKIDKHKMC